MHLLSYNLYGVLNSNITDAPSWHDRLCILQKHIPYLLDKYDIDVAFFQEVNEYNMDMLKGAINGYYMLKLFPMTTNEGGLQYNVTVIKNSLKEAVTQVNCEPHGFDSDYLPPEKQRIDYGMSDYRTTVFTHLCLNNKKYILGNTHTDYISVEGKILGIRKSLDYIKNRKHEKGDFDFALVFGDMNMVAHMAEVHQILRNRPDFTTCHISKVNGICLNSYHGYGSQESVNVDFAFVPSINSAQYKWECIVNGDGRDDGSDHYPVMLTINDGINA